MRNRFRNRALANLPEVFRPGRLDPFREFSLLQNEIDRVFDDFMLPVMSTLPQERWMGFEPLCDIEETEKNFIVNLDLPGVHKEDVKIEVRDHQLAITGERKEHRREENVLETRIERTHGRFFRTFALPTLIDSEKLEAVFQNGILTITIPKSEVSKGRLVQILDRPSLEKPEVKEVKEGRETKEKQKVA